ncbi:DUF5615 family PIN-like protein [Telmatobacter bradus]|uniref:DUF5615 family PIN-like protein n=1 Tax=Telmatobacter bradus TaxID=474953 RepID=UPI003B43240F
MAAAIEDLYSGSCHISQCGLSSAPDEEVWRYAAAHDYSIVSKDSDFAERSALRGFPPKVIWLRIGNCSTIQAINLLRSAFAQIDVFLSTREESCLVLTETSKRPVQGVKPPA